MSGHHRIPPKTRNIHLMLEHELEFRLKDARKKKCMLAQKLKSYGVSVIEAKLLDEFQHAIDLYEEELSERILLDKH